MERKIIIDLLDDFAFGSHNIEQTADRIIEHYKKYQQSDTSYEIDDERFNTDIDGGN